MVKEMINKHLLWLNKGTDWLSTKTDIPVEILDGILKDNSAILTQERLNLINSALETKFKLDPPAEKTA